VTPLAEPELPTHWDTSFRDLLMVQSWKSSPLSLMPSAVMMNKLLQGADAAMDEARVVVLEEPWPLVAVQVPSPWVVVDPREMHPLAERRHFPARLRRLNLFDKKNG
jgi:hypothetical protein